MSTIAHDNILMPSTKPVYMALKSVLSVLAPEMHIECAQAGEPKPHTVRTIGTILALSKGECFEELRLLQKSGAQKVIVLRPWHHDIPAWDSLHPEDRFAFEDYCIHATPDVQMILGAIPSTLKNTDDKIGQECRRRVFAARTCYDRVADLTHGSVNDVVNCIYAPARMLCLSHKRRSDADITSAWAAWWSADTTRAAYESLRKDVFASSEDALTVDLLDAWNNAKVWLAKNDSQPPPIDNAPIAQIDRLMSLLTSIRQRAGMSVHSQNLLPSVEPSPLIVGNGCGIRETRSSSGVLEPYRLLVVDDHAASWRPVLELVANSLSKDERLSKRPVRVDFATSVEAEVLKRIPEYDLILLDVYLPGASERAGIDLLKRVRARAGHLPVILWTSSMDQELPAEASFAGGFLFKKTATVESVSEALAGWLSSGRSRRLWSLPNPFFDNAIRDTALREVALYFTKWTLRYMDCFHAIDDFHFRYFNDHGGRHIIGVFNVMEKLLRPFLLADTGVVLAKEDNEREHDLFCLYIAILCHEYGMFPILNTDESFTETTLPRGYGAAVEAKRRQDAMDARRSIHAIRGMLMLAARLGENIPPESRYSVAGLAASLAKLDNTEVPNCRLLVALLVGYHQRLLPLGMTETGVDCFLRFGNGPIKQWEKPLKKLDVANENLGRSKINREWITTIMDIAGGEGGFSPDRKKRLREQCAILRFADALDADQTRTPADFLLKERNSRRPMQDVEDCKRLVMVECDIDEGRVSVVFAAPEPNASQLDILLPLFQRGVEWHEHNGENEGVRSKAAEAKAWQMKDARMRRMEMTKCMPAMKDVWDAEWPSGDMEEQSVGRMEDLLTFAVAGYFVRPDPGKIGSHVLSDQEENELRRAQPAVSTAAAILVLLEILDEYGAIQDADLSGAIHLNPSVEWIPDRGLPFILDLALCS